MTSSVKLRSLGYTARFDGSKLSTSGSVRSLSIAAIASSRVCAPGSKRAAEHHGQARHARRQSCGQVSWLSPGVPFTWQNPSPQVGTPGKQPVLPQSWGQLHRPSSSSQTPFPQTGQQGHSIAGHRSVKQNSFGTVVHSSLVWQDVLGSQKPFTVM